MTAAKRELLEETGIDESSYKIVSGRWYVESKQDDDKPHIVYYAARLQNFGVVLAPQDTKEIRNADWFTPATIYTMRTELYLQRRQIVTKAIRDLTMKKLIHGPLQQHLPPVHTMKNFSAKKMVKGNVAKTNANGNTPVETAPCSSSLPCS